MSTLPTAPAQSPAPRAARVGMDMIAPYGVYVGPDCIAVYDTEQEAQRHYDALRAAVTTEGGAA